MQNKVIKVAVTGGIGSGKSTFIKILSELGFLTISCDEEIVKIYREIEVIAKIKKLFPEAIENNKINKKIISNIVFENKKRLNELNGYMHPIVLKRCFEKADKESEKGIAFIEVPLLFESNLENKFDKIIVVLRDREERIESVINRTKLSRQEIEQRMKNQIDYDKNDFSKYIIIKNNGRIYEEREKILPIIEKIVQETF